MENKVFQYEGHDITFLLGNRDMMVNATEMAKFFNKQPSDWTRLKQTDEFISSLSAVRGIPRTDLFIVKKGGNDKHLQGFWFHEDLAMEFARWLSPMFAIWCNDRLKELMKYGFTATDDMLETLLANPEYSLTH